MKKTIILKRILVRKIGQVIQFQIKLPPDTMKVTGIKVSTMLRQLQAP